MHKLKIVSQKGADSYIEGTRTNMEGADENIQEGRAMIAQNG
jgi:hypothetical protein